MDDSYYIFFTYKTLAPLESFPYLIITFCSRGSDGRGRRKTCCNSGCVNVFGDRTLNYSTANMQIFFHNNTVRRTRYAGHCWRGKGELISDILLWIPSHERAKVGRQARAYIQQLCANTRCSLEDLPRAMDYRDGW